MNKRDANAKVQRSINVFILHSQSKVVLASF